MASEYTTNFNLDKYTSSDKPNLRDQYNSAMDKIDDQLHKLDSKYNDTSNGLFAFTQKAKEITEKYDSLNSRLTDNEASINEAKATIEDNKKIARDDAKKNADDIKENAKNLKLAEGDRHSLHTMLDTVSTRVTGLNEDVDIAKQEVHNFEKKIGEFQEEIKTNDRENKEAIADVDKRVNNKFDTYKHETDAGIAVIKGDLKAHVKVCDEKLAKNIQAIEETKRDLTVTNKAVADQSVRDDENFLRAMQAINENKDKIKANTQKNEQQDEAISNARTKEEQDHLAQQKQIDANITQLEQHKSTLSEHDARIHDNTDKINKYHDEDVAYKKTYSEKVDNAVVKVDQFNKDLLEAKKQITDQSVRDDTNFNDVKQKYSEVKELADKHDNTIKNLIYFADTTKAVFTDVDKALQDRYSKAESDAKYETIANATAHDQSLEVTQNKLDAVEAKQNEINTKTLQHDEAIQHLKDNVAGRATAQDLTTFKQDVNKELQDRYTKAESDAKYETVGDAASHAQTLEVTQNKVNAIEEKQNNINTKTLAHDEAIQNLKNDVAARATSQDLALLKEALDQNKDGKLDFIENAEKLNQLESSMHTELEKKATRDELTQAINNAKNELTTNNDTKFKDYETKADAEVAHNELKSSIKAATTDIDGKLEKYVTTEQASKDYSDLHNAITQTVIDTKNLLNSYETKADADTAHTTLSENIAQLNVKLIDKADKSEVPNVDTIKQAVATDAIAKLDEKLKDYQTVATAKNIAEQTTIAIQGVNTKVDTKANKSDVPTLDSIKQALATNFADVRTEIDDKIKNKPDVYVIDDNQNAIQGSTYRPVKTLYATGNQDISILKDEVTIHSPILTDMNYVKNNTTQVYGYNDRKNEVAGPEGEETYSAKHELLPHVETTIYNKASDKSYDKPGKFNDNALTTVDYVEKRVKSAADSLTTTIQNNVQNALEPKLTELMKSSRDALDKKTSVYTYKDNVGNPVSSINTTVGIDEINYDHIDNCMGGQPALADTKYVDWAVKYAKNPQFIQYSEEDGELKKTPLNNIDIPIADYAIDELEKEGLVHAIDFDSGLTTKAYVDKAIKKNAGGSTIYSHNDIKLDKVNITKVQHTGRINPNEPKPTYNDNELTTVGYVNASSSVILNNEGKRVRTVKTTILPTTPTSSTPVYDSNDLVTVKYLNKYIQDNEKTIIRNNQPLLFPPNYLYAGVNETASTTKYEYFLWIVSYNTSRGQVELRVNEWMGGKQSFCLVPDKDISPDYPIPTDASIVSTGICKSLKPNYYVEVVVASDSYKIFVYHNNEQYMVSNYKVYFTHTMILN